MNDLSTHSGIDFYLYSMTTLAVVSFMLFILSSVLLWIKYKSSFKEAHRSAFVNGYVDSMVHTYFYGYLKKIIPDPGIVAGDNQLSGGLYEKIKMYKEKENLTDQDFPLHKIFIIICASGYVPNSLEKIDKERIVARKSLEPLVINRAGTNGRKYTTAVYKVKYRDLKRHITVAMEGTPPLLTLHDAAKEDPELREHQKQIIELFYKKLSSKLAENIEFANSYEVVFYNDDPRSPTLADEIILRHIDKGFVSEHEALTYPPNFYSDNETLMLA